MNYRNKGVFETKECRLEIQQFGENSMSDKKDFTRREFLSRSGKIAAGVGTVLAAPAINVLGANDKIYLGIIGPGRRGRAITMLCQQMAAEKKKPVEFIGVADIFEGWREQAVREIQRNNARFELEETKDIETYADHKKLLENKDIDGVIVATPEHLHAQHMLDVIAAGKDLYIEKPMVHTVEEGKTVVAAAKKSDCVIQCGTMRRSVPLYYQARDLIKSGAIGEVHYTEGWWHRNFKDDEPGAAWRYEIPEDANEDTIIWKDFIGPAPFVPFDTQRYFQWRCYWEYSNGIGSDLMVHQMDVINLVMGVTMPKSVVSSGDIYRWKDGRTSPDTWSSVFEYEEGFQANYRSQFSNKHQEFGIRIMGSEGTIEILMSALMNIFPEPAPYGNEKLEKKTVYYPEDNTGGNFMTAHFESVKDHFANWIDCMVSRDKPSCDVETGYYGSALSSMAVDAYQQGKRLYWDKEREKVYS
ncbi:MAG: gfo/Idh/MocA family oxidoreductase [Candidatus Omnitrophota bacterium]|jgi:predicted dehydrogenase|nr:MAG: gfo/Idh/MocA family oxidoreductase [Candidatus Omnitrophota bacterium]